MRRLLLAVFAAVPLIAIAQTLRIEADGGAAAMLAAAGSGKGILSGSTFGALAKLCRGQIAVAGAARRASAEERGRCAQDALELIEIPLATDSAVLVVNPANTWVKQLDLADLRRAWLDTPGKAKSWRQLNSAWPDTPLKLYGPAPKLGLASFARAALNGDSAEPAALRTDLSATEVLSVAADGVARDRLALGLLDHAAYASNMKRVRRVPTDAALQFRLYAYTTGKALEDPAVRAYLDRLLANASRYANEAGLVPFAPEAYARARAQMSGGKAVQ